MIWGGPTLIFEGTCTLISGGNTHAAPTPTPQVPAPRSVASRSPVPSGGDRLTGAKERPPPAAMSVSPPPHSRHLSPVPPSPRGGKPGALFYLTAAAATASSSFSSPLPLGGGSPGHSRASRRTGASIQRRPTGSAYLPASLTGAPCMRRRWRLLSASLPSASRPAERTKSRPRGGRAAGLLHPRLRGLFHLTPALPPSHNRLETRRGAVCPTHAPFTT